MAVFFLLDLIHESRDSLLLNHIVINPSVLAACSLLLLLRLILRPDVDRAAYHISELVNGNLLNSFGEDINNHNAQFANLIGGTVLLVLAELIHSVMASIISSVV